jgi:hypothetical protein
MVPVVFLLGFGLPALVKAGVLTGEPPWITLGLRSALQRRP